MKKSSKKDQKEITIVKVFIRMYCRNNTEYINIQTYLNFDSFNKLL